MKTQPAFEEVQISALDLEKAHRGESEVRDAMCDRTPPIPGHAAYLPRGRGTDQPLATVEKTGILVKPTFVLLHQGCFSPDVGPHISTTASDGGARVFPSVVKDRSRSRVVGSV